MHGSGCARAARCAPCHVIHVDAKGDARGVMRPPAVRSNASSSAPRAAVFSARPRALSHASRQQRSKRTSSAASSKSPRRGRRAHSRHVEHAFLEQPQHRSCACARRRPASARGSTRTARAAGHGARSATSRAQSSTTPTQPCRGSGSPAASARSSSAPVTGVLAAAGPRHSVARTLQHAGQLRTRSAHTLANTDRRPCAAVNSSKMLPDSCHACRCKHDALTCSAAASFRLDAELAQRLRTSAQSSRPYPQLEVQRRPSVSFSSRRRHCRCAEPFATAPMTMACARRGRPDHAATTSWPSASSPVPPFHRDAIGSLVSSSVTSRGSSRRCGSLAAVGELVSRNSGGIQAGAAR